MLRGINRQPIFLDEEDGRHFLGILRLCGQISGFRLFAYCLMKNHIHLLLKTEKEPLELAMKRIGTRFVVWYNAKYARVGHLFQDRYKSEPVCDDAYFFTVLRYILYNPVKAGLCEKPEEYLLSSARDYFSGGGITDTAFAEEISGRDALLQFLRTPGEDKCLDDTAPRLDERRAKLRLCELTQSADVVEAGKMIAAQPEQYVAVLRRAGLSIRQICRLTGLPFGIVRKY